LNKEGISMDRTSRELLLANGLVVRFVDRTVRYYGDFYRVQLEVRCSVPLTVDLFPGMDEFSAAKAILGDEVTYCRTLDRMGVPSTEIDRVIDTLIADFSEHSGPYFAAREFPKKLVHAELKKTGRAKGTVCLSP
jgi:hypothetical protein